MKKIKLGNSKLEVTQLGLGCINFGTTVEQKLSFELMNKYVELGGNFFDTANNYAIWNSGDGRDSERMIGSWLEESGNRKDIVLATKLGALPKEVSKRDFSYMQGLSEKVIYEEVEKSLESLQTDYIDLLYLHVDDVNTDQEEYLYALNKVIEKGYVREIGCSNFYSWRVESARQICKNNNFKFFSAIQQRLSYLTPAMDADFNPQIIYNNELKAYLDYHKDMTLVSYSALLNGLYNKNFIDDTAYQTWYNEEKFLKLKAIKNPNLYVLNYVINLHEGSVALITSSKIKHLIENMSIIKE